MAAIPCQDRSTQCLLRPDDVSLCQNEIAKLLLHDIRSGDSHTEHDPRLSRKSLPAGKRRGRSTGKLRKKQPARQTDVNSESIDNSDALEPSATANGCLTRRAKYILDRDKAAVAKSRVDYRKSVNKTPKRRASDDGSATDEDCSRRLMYNDQSVVYDTGTADIIELHDADRNHNANREREGQTCADRNSYARRSRRKKARIITKRCNVRRKAPIKTSRTRLVNFSSLKPISATCSPSGLGLVVTYRPVFSQTSRKRKRKRPVNVAAQPGNANNNVQSHVCLRDFGTSPRTPSPEKRRESECTFYDRIAAFTKRPRSSEREHGVKKWLQGIPQPATSPRIRQHRSPSPGRRKKPSTRGEAFQRPFKIANLSARKAAVPGPSWAPDELTHPASRSTSPLYLSRVTSGPQHPNRSVGSPRSLSPKRRPPSPGTNMEEVFADHSAKTKARPTKSKSSSLSPPLSSRRVISEGWEVKRSNSSDRKNISSRGRRRGGRGSRSPGGVESAAEDLDHVTTQRDKATSVSRTRHYIVPKSRSQSRSFRSSHSSGSRESRKERRHHDRETSRLGERSRHHRHRRRHDREENSTEAGVCSVM